VLGAVQSVNYGYDAVDQLQSETSTEATPQVKSTFNYDLMGNRTTSSDQGAGIGGTLAKNVRWSSTSNRLNQLNSLGVTQTDNSTSSQSFTYDSRGNTTRSESTASDSYTIYAYDDANRLTTVLFQKRSNQPSPYLNISRSFFAYDGLGRRRTVTEQSFSGTTNSTGTWTTVSQTRFVYNGLDVVQERDGSNVVRANLTRTGNIGGLLARQTYTSAGALDKTAFYSYDGSGNVVGTTDAAQNVQSAYLYDAFGQSQLVQENAGYSQPYRYSTKWQHAQSGLYDYGYRFYNAGLGRWINRDPIGEEGGVNLYGMTDNNPSNSLDEYGEQVLASPMPYLPYFAPLARIAPIAESMTLPRVMPFPGEVLPPIIYPARNIGKRYPSRSRAKDASEHPRPGKKLPPPPKNAPAAKRDAYRDQQKYKNPERHPDTPYPRSHFHNRSKGSDASMGRPNPHNYFPKNQSIGPFGPYSYDEDCYPEVV